ncbi:MAG: hypothetical protein KAS32_18065 [Candidatus Peribacteraceae bacterium]|nr:hypothetical protein [Candidatus Peribacteraceae bacterium]
MSIIGLSFDSVHGDRDKEKRLTAEMKVNSVPRINDVKEVNVPTIGNKKVLSLTFEFVTNYDPKVGEIKISGDLLYMAKDNKALLKQWAKEKKLPEDTSLEILNYLFRKCLLKVSTIAEDLQLPPPIPMPTIKPKE